METDDLRKLMNEVLAVHKELEHHVVRMMERQGDLEAMMKEMEGWAQETQALVRQGAERQGALETCALCAANNETPASWVRLNTLRGTPGELDARLRRLEERRKNGRG
jgi:16S rRNA C967 or C1407 C5-methylase (RsmB/RsmF family)